MATKFAGLNIPDLATSLGIEQSKVREIANTLQNEQVSPTADLVAQVVQLCTAKNCDPILAAQEIAKNSKGNSDRPIEEADDSDLVQMLANQSYEAIAPFVPIVQDLVKARFLIEVGSGFSQQKNGKHTSSVLGIFNKAAKDAAAKLPSYSTKGLFGSCSPLAIAPSVEQLD